MSKRKNNIESEYAGYSVYKGTRSKPITEFLELPEKKQKTSRIWVSATKTSNAMINNHLIDWLNLYGNDYLEHQDTTQASLCSNFLCNKGIDFEKKILNELSSKYQVSHGSRYYSIDAVSETYRQMCEGVPVISSASLANKSKATYGIADLLIRSDYIPKIFPNKLTNHQNIDVKAPKLNGNYHYRVVEIKFCTIYLAGSGTYVQNGGNFPAYKAQLAIYNEALGVMQGYTPPIGYLVGRSSRYSQNDTVYLINNPFDRPGIVHLTPGHQIDGYIHDSVDNAITWYRDVQTKGAQWSIDPPSRQELYPNMNIESGKWQKTKYMIANKIGEISLLWRCGVSNRLKSIENNVKSFKDPACNGKLLGFNEQYSENIDNIIKVNTSDVNILPVNIDDYELMVQDDDEFYIDFETLSDICKSTEYNSLNSMIFMIGVGWFSDGKWQYRNFLADDATTFGEHILMHRFQHFIFSKSENPKLFFWHAEKIFWKQAIARQNMSDNMENAEWCNLMSYFINNKIAIKGSFNYKLKSIGNAMYNLGLIKTKLEAECSNGLMAMVNAFNCYQKYHDPLTAPVMKDIQHYNHFDCKIMYDILNYFRSTHPINLPTPTTDQTKTI